MNQVFARITTLTLGMSLLVPALVSAQEQPEKPEKTEKTERVEKREQKDRVEQKEHAERKETQQIVISTDAGVTKKYVIEVDGDKVTVNGKPLEGGKDNNMEGVSITRRKFKDGARDVTVNGYGNWNRNMDSPDRPMLGVNTSTDDKGVRITDVTDNSGAEKAGLKEDDIITKIGGVAITSPDQLSKVVREHKIGERVDINYLRAGKDMKATAELGKYEGFQGMQMFSDDHDNFNTQFDFKGLDPMELKNTITAPFIQNWISASSTRLGLLVQDTDEGKGVKVLNVEDDGNAAKAGIEEEDVILSVDGKDVNGADEIARIIKDSKDKTSVKFKMTRNGSPKTVDVRVPRKLKTASL